MVKQAIRAGQPTQRVSLQFNPWNPTPGISSSGKTSDPRGPAYMAAAGHEERNRHDHAQRMLAMAKARPRPPPRPRGDCCLSMVVDHTRIGVVDSQ